MQLKTIAAGMLLLPLTALASSVTGDQVQLQKAIDEALYKIDPDHGAFRAQNLAHGLDAQFTRASTKLNAGTTTLELRLLDWGIPYDTKAEGRRLERSYRGLREWFINSAAGVEQGFVIEKKPAKLRIRLAVEGGWQATGQGDKMVFTQGTTQLEYSGLRAWDARGAALPAQMRPRKGGIEIEVDDARAVYPVTVDPTVTQQAFLTIAGTSNFGNSVALSPDGNTALIGAPSTTVGGNVGQGAAFVFTRSGSSWTQQAELLESTYVTGAANDSFGSSVALSADGNFAIVGAPNKNFGNGTFGAAFVFARTGTTWQITDFLGHSNTQRFGFSVAMSGDASTFLFALVGDPADNTVYAYQSTLVAHAFGFLGTITDNVTGSNFGWAVALTSDSSTGFVGAPSNSDVLVFTRSGASPWTVESTIIGPVGTDFGTSLAITPDGSSVLVGAPNLLPDGAAYLYTGSGGTWTQQASFSPQGEIGPVGGYKFGDSVALTPSGTNAFIGAQQQSVGNNAGQGAVYEFFESGGSWSLQQLITAPSDGSASAGAAGDNFGQSVAVAVNSGATTALIGAPFKSASQGAVYVFTSRDLTSLLNSLITVVSGSNLPAPIQSLLIGLLEKIEQLPIVSETLTPQQKTIVTGVLQTFIAEVRLGVLLRLVPAALADQFITQATQFIASLSTP